MTASSISGTIGRIFLGGMSDGDDPVCLATMSVSAELLGDAGIEWDTPPATVLRSCLMKPEHVAEVPRLHERVLALASAG